MKKYTLAFIFNKELEKVLLIRKNKPVEQAGLLNGIGGKMEEFDVTFLDCIKREVEEETGLVLKKEDFINVGNLTDDEHYIVEVFTAQIEDTLINTFKKLTDEDVVLLDISNGINELKQDEFSNNGLSIMKHCLEHWKSQNLWIS